MFERILVAYDGSRGAEAALRMAIDLAKALGAELLSISVEERLPRYAATIGEVQEAKAKADAYFHDLTKHARDVALESGVELETILRQGRESEAILGLAREEKADLLVIGYEGHASVLGRLIGSTALTVARLASCSVLLVRSRGTRGEGIAGIKRILVGLDGSPLGRLAFHTALNLAILGRGSVLGVTVREVAPQVRPETVDWSGVQRLQTAAAEHARAADIGFEGAALVGHAAQTLSDQARERRVDLIVLGATGLEHPWSPTLGGTATRIAGDAPVDVLLVRPRPAVLHVRDVMVRGVSSVRPDTPLAEVVDLLLRRNVKAVPVVDKRRRVVGTITGGDLLRRGHLELRLSIQRELDPEILRERLADLARSPKSAGDVMTHPVHTVAADTDLVSAVRLMVSRRVKRLPVVDREGQLIGMISRADVLRAIAAMPEPAEEAEQPAPGVARTLADVVTSRVPTVPPDALAETVLPKLLESPLRRVVVVGAEGRVVGIISDRDLLLRSTPDARPWLLRALTGLRPGHRPGEPASPGQLTARDMMAPSLVTVRPEDSLTHAIRLMMQHQVKRLVVVDEAGRLCGLVDRREILRALAARPIAPPEG